MRVEAKNDAYIGFSEVKFSDTLATFKVIPQVWDEMHAYLLIYEKVQCYYCGKEIWLEYPVKGSETPICPECVSQAYLSGHHRVGDFEEPAP